MKIDYGFQILPGMVLHISDTEKWLLQPELKAIKDGLKYGEIEKILQNGNKCSYRGYIDKKGIPQEVGIESFDYGLSHIG
jgi:hypothetical protein